jgi:hypothetical protein
MNAPVKNPPITFAEAFCKLQAQIKPAIKDSLNPHFKSKYADLGAVWEAVKDPLHEHGFAVIQSPDFEGENMFLKTTILHVGGEKMEGRYPIRPSKNDPQGVASAITYARRYSISAMLGVIADDDDDGNAASAPRSTPAPAQPPTQREVIHTPKTMPQDDDVVRGNRNWLDIEKANITACERLPDMYQWLDENGESWSEPTSGSNLWKTKRSCPAHFEEIKAHYQERLKQINAKGTK